MFRFLRIWPGPIRSTRQWFLRLVAGSRRGCKLHATPIFVSIGKFDPTPLFRTTGLPGPVQSACYLPNSVVFGGFGRVVAVDRSQNRYGSTPLTSDKGVDTTGQKWRISGHGSNQGNNFGWPKSLDPW